MQCPTCVENFMKIYWPILVCVISGLSWKLNENAFIHFSIMLSTQTDPTKNNSCIQGVKCKKSQKCSRFSPVSCLTYHGNVMKIHSLIFYNVANRQTNKQTNKQRWLHNLCHLLEVIRHSWPMACGNCDPIKSLLCKEGQYIFHKIWIMMFVKWQWYAQALGI